MRHIRTWHLYQTNQDTTYTTGAANVYILLLLYFAGISSLCLAAYRLYTLWVHNYLGRGVRKVISSCAVTAIRAAFPKRHPSHYHEFEEIAEEPCDEPLWPG